MRLLLLLSINQYFFNTQKGESVSRSDRALIGGASFYHFSKKAVLRGLTPRRPKGPLLGARAVHFSTMTLRPR